MEPTYPLADWGRGAGCLIAVTGASLVLWWTLWRFVRWVVL